MTNPPSVAVERVRVRDAKSADGHRYQPAWYEITDPAEVAEVLALWPAEQVPEPGSGGPAEADPGIDHFVCMCMEHRADPLDTTDDPAIRHVPPVRPGPLARLLDRDAPDGIPARHRARWAAAAPGALRDYAGSLARGEDPPRPARIPLAAAFSWQGAVREHPTDAASLLAELAPGRLLVGAATEDLAWAVRETDRGGLDAAVRFFASEEFTTRHPKRRRVPDTARDLLLRHARSHRPRDLPVLERRLLRMPDDRVRRS
ncbi:hypothetical protein [Streptomyces sp. NBC_01264]|uniref:hypothetical protein n=1 Tax=Streptomyces sp. NBC_01264 TaxID=2903804 RepID=UPI0022585A94|nr:hypothetical protein [Streptomyces sp. NBC_01264]MCX4783254.1 hypothetical protein [Streptomyces sp. NBC_01264]